MYLKLIKKSSKYAFIHQKCLENEIKEYFLKDLGTSVLLMD